MMPASPLRPPTSMTPALVTPDAATLPLKGAALGVEARGGLARVVLEQRFANPNPVALHVVYTLPLPHDAAVSGFSFTVGERTIEGEIDVKRRARERFEEAVATGRTAALLEEERGSLFTQEIGNVPPGAEVIARITLDQRLVWLEEGQWEWRFPLAAAPRYLGAPGRVVDAPRVSFGVAEELPVRASLELLVSDALPPGRSPESPSHPLQCAQVVGGFRVGFGGSGAAPLDRDAVVRWDAAGLEVGVSASICGPSTVTGASHRDTHLLLTLVPPRKGARTLPLPRDLTILLDTSGSMGGEPLTHAKRVASALVESLAPADAFELIEFSNAPRAFRRSAQAATAASKKEALAWIRDLRASGGTEMKDGILAALAPLRAGSQKQVVLLSDGLIGFESEIVSAILGHLPDAARVHTVGVGSAVNRSLMTPAARAGRGIEVLVGLGEDVERAVARLTARTLAPLVTEVEISGSAVLEVAPRKMPDLFAGSPALALVRARAEGGELVVRGRTSEGPWIHRMHIARNPTPEHGAVPVLFGREAVEDLELRLAAGESRGVIDAEIERVGIAYRIATRKTSWVAVDRVISVDPTRPTRREAIPQALPHGMSAEGLGLRAPSPASHSPVLAHMPMEGFLDEEVEAEEATEEADEYATDDRTRAEDKPMPVMARPVPPPAQAAKRPMSEAAPGPARRAKMEIMGPPPPPKAPAPAPAAAPPGAPPEPPRPSLLERARTALFGPKRDEDSAESAVERAAPADREKAPAKEKAALADKKSARARKTARRALAGRIVRWARGELTVEITLDDEIEWLLGQLRVSFEGGAELPGTVDGTRSTAPGTYGAGMTLRLVIQVAGKPSGGPVSLSIDGPFGTLVVALGA